MYSASEFAFEFMPVARELTKGTRVLPELLISQAILESSGKYQGKYVVGGSKLARDANNYFGIKAFKSWKGDTVEMNTTEIEAGTPVTVKAKFRKYATPIDSLKDYLHILTTQKNYAPVLKETTFAGQAAAMGRTGYSTEPTYGERILSVGKSIANVAVDVATSKPGRLALAAVALGIGFYALSKNKKRK